eukprot:scaffold1747_cov108-Isochrysis_galbana.AAC.8
MRWACAHGGSRESVSSGISAAAAAKIRCNLSDVISGKPSSRKWSTNASKACCDHVVWLSSARPDRRAVAAK